MSEFSRLRRSGEGSCIQLNLDNTQPIVDRYPVTKGENDFTSLSIASIWLR
jgi:hypothetical protein